MAISPISPARQGAPSGPITADDVARDRLAHDAPAG